MKIEISEFVEGAGRAEGLAVIIDVFRAFSVDAMLTMQEPHRLLLLQLLKRHSDSGKDIPEHCLSEKGRRRKYRDSILAIVPLKYLREILKEEQLYTQLLQAHRA